jgi:hypothetical protein
VTDNYAKIVEDNLLRLYADLPKDLGDNLPAETSGDQYVFEAFGETCVISSGGITLGGERPLSVLGILISLYALHACPDACILHPFKAFKEFPDSAPYVGAFATHTEQLLVSHVEKIQAVIPVVAGALGGREDTSSGGGDFSFVVYPMPKIALRYVFYEADDEFPASVTCLFSCNAHRFLPMDGLADVGEYTSRKIVTMLDTS